MVTLVVVPDLGGFAEEPVLLQAVANAAAMNTIAPVLSLRADLSIEAYLFGMYCPVGRERYHRRRRAVPRQIVLTTLKCQRLNRHRL
jgi:hypothetical protein